MNSIFQIPKRLAVFPVRAQVYRTENLPMKQSLAAYWQMRLEQLSSFFGFTVIKPEEDEDHLFIREGPLFLQIFKASNSFLFYNTELVAPAVQDLEMMNPKKAKLRAIELLKAQNLIFKSGSYSTPFQTFYAGDGYTMAQTADAGFTPDNKWNVTEESELYKTEIQSHFGYLLNGLPVFGPGAKTIISNVGEQLSEQVHFWRNPGEAVSEKEIMPPEAAINRLGKESWFSKVIQMNKKYPGQSSGRFYDDVELGYYATPPFNNQRFYVPVYKIRGTFESRVKINNMKYSGVSAEDKTFRYDFIEYVSALQGESSGLQMSAFKRQIVF